jgi:hypothetical protein
MSSVSTDTKLPRSPRRYIVVDGDAVDAGARRSEPHLRLEPVNRLEVPFGDDFHRSIRPIRHPTTHTLQPGGSFGKVAEADALHPTSDHEPSRHEHAEQYRRPPALGRLASGVALSLRRSVSRVDFWVDGTNMLDATYREVAGVDMPGRWITAGVSVR